MTLGTKAEIKTVTEIQILPGSNKDGCSTQDNTQAITPEFSAV